MGTDGLRPESLRCAARGRLVLFAHGVAPPSDEDWESVLGLFAQLGDLDDARVLVHTDGAAPSVVQRGKLNDLFAGRQPRIALLTTSKIARAAGVALRWFNPRFRVFQPGDFDDAMGHLEVTREEAALLRTMMAALKAELGTTGRAATDGARSQPR